MNRARVMLTAIVGCAMVALLATVAAAGSASSGPEKPAAGSSDAAALADRVDALQKENLVLREDLGKARLDARTQLEAAAKRHADAIARLQKQLDEANARSEEERQKQAQRNRYLWYAIGGLALGIVLTR